MQLNFRDKIRVSIYSGCDYLDNVKGIGFGTVIKYFPENEDGLRSKIIKSCKEGHKMGSNILPDDITTTD